jgi:NADH-quinone oxidoreductase subunit G
VQVANQLTENRVHGVLNRGEHAEISTYIENAVDNDFSGNMIDVCPVGALTDKTFRFKSRVWFLKPMEAECSCDKCAGKTVLWMFGDEIYRVTARKDRYGEVEDMDGKPGWICNDCRFDKKDPSKWNIIGPRVIDRHSVISQGKYATNIRNNAKKLD